MTQGQEWKTRGLKLEEELAGTREDKSELVGTCYLIYVERNRNSSYFPSENVKKVAMKYFARIKIIMIFLQLFPFWNGLTF